MPIDDTPHHGLTFCLVEARHRAAHAQGRQPDPGLGARRWTILPTTAPAGYGRWRLKANRDNDYLIDREEQEGGTYTGIQGLGQQDQAMVESMEGPEEGIVDRGFEHLAAERPHDRHHPAAHHRRGAGASEGRHVPATVDRPELTRGARGGSFICADSIDWLDAYAEELRKAQSPAGFLLQAAE